MRIHYHIIALESGGAERRCVRLSAALSRMGHEVHLTTERDPGFYADQVAPAVRFRQVCRREDRLPRYLQAVWRAVRTVRADVFHAFMIGLPYGTVIARTCGVPAVVVSMVTDWQDTLDPVQATAERVAARAAHAITVNSHGMRDYYLERQGVAPRKVHLIPNFVPTDGIPFRDPVLRAEVRRELGLSDDSFAFLTVGRLTSQKDPLGLVAAAADVAARQPEARWFWAGEGELDRRLREQVVAAGLGGRVQLLGTRKDVPRLLQGMDAFVLPSRYEGMPNALLEAMAAGLPAVGTRVSGTSELILPGRTGWLVPARDPAALAAAMGAAVADRRRGEEFGRQARQRIERHYSQAMISERFLHLYQDLLAGRRAS